MFTDAIHRGLEQEFGRLLALGTSERPAKGRFSRTIPGYDAYAVGFPPRLEGAFEVFHSRSFHLLIAQLMQVNATGDVNGGLHHHPPGSAGGHPHNDLNPGHFIDAPRADGINPSNDALCCYTSGRQRTNLPVRETVRAVAIIYYLGNGPWSPGDGGETGLFVRNPTGFQPAVMVPPLDNSMLVFECSPHSYHAFVTNRRKPRNSVILWLHRTKAEAVSRWGEASIVRWSPR